MNQNTKDLTKEEKKFKLNMEILSSLKPLKGKSINLQSDYIFQKKEKEDTNKNNAYTFEDLLSTSNSIPKISQNKIQNKSYTTNSAFKPISINQSPHRSQTLNYYNTEYNSLMSFPNIFFDNQKIFNQNMINNFLINQNIFLNNNLLNKKRKSENEKIQKKNDDIIKKNNYLKNEIINNNKKNVFIVTKKEETKITPKISEISSKKNMFNVYKKSKYIFRKRRRRVKKELHIKNIKNSCGHEGCEGVFKTKKQLFFHHYKMSIDCHKDTISLLKLIFNLKKILLNIDENKEKKIFENISSLYKETLKNVSMDEYIEAIVGFNFED